MALRNISLLGAIVLEIVCRNGELSRNLVIEKMRCTDVKPSQHRFDIIKGDGVVIEPLP